MEEKFKRYSAREAAKAVGCSHATIYNLVNAKKIPLHRTFNGHVFFTEQDINEILNSLRVVPEQPEQ